MGPWTQRECSNDAADAYAKGAAARGIPDKNSRLAAERISAAFLKRRAAEGQHVDGKMIRQNGTRERGLSKPKSKPRIRPHLWTMPKAFAGQFYQLLSGHAMTAPFLKENGDGLSQTSAGSGEGRQNLEHFSKECTLKG